MAANLRLLVEVYDTDNRLILETLPKTMRLITAGRPCGPWKGHGRFMLLRNGCLTVAVLEIIYFANVMSACLGAFVSIHLGYEDLEKYYPNKKKLSLLYITLIFQAAAHFVGLGIAIFALMAYLKRKILFCHIYIFGIIVVHVISLVGLIATSLTVNPTMTFTIGSMTFVRAYFIWVMMAYYLEIKMYPEGFPPPSRPAVKAPKQPSPVPTKASSLHYVGDG